MPIAPGTRLGPYVVDTLIGAGGMGEVYRATDPNLARSVAIKVLPESMAADADRLARFDREAKTLAVLNHPNIALIYGVERSDRQLALIMELVEGETLADRIAGGPLPVDEALAIATQIANALEAAHEQGIVHRDLKPANIKLRPDGQIKVLDFGLAKAMERSGSSAAAASGVTAAVTSPALVTEAGMILGTAAYMAPEQAKGRVVDKRADIWAFGVIVYEMVTGKPLFAGDTVVETLAAVVTKTPDLSGAPAKLRPLLRATLDPDPRRRLRDIGDAFRLIETVPSSGEARAPSSRALLIGLSAVATAAVLLAGFTWASRPATPAPDPVRLQINLPPDAQPDTGMALSPDGRRLAFMVGGATGGRSAWVRDLDSLEARPVRGAENLITNPLFWSHDSRWLGFASGDSVRKVNVVDGGDPMVVTRAGSIGASWNAEGTIVFGTNPGRNAGGGLYRVSAAGGDPTPLTVVDSTRGEVAHHHPTFLPDGRRFLYLRTARPDERSGIYLGALDTKPEEQSTERLIATSYGPVFFVPSGAGDHGLLYYLRDNVLLAQRFDSRRTALMGEPFQVASPVGAFIDRALFSVSRHGTIVYTTSAAALMRQLTWIDRDGTQLSVASQAANLADAALSPDGTKAAVAVLDLTSPAARFETWIWDLARGTQTLFSTGGSNPAPVSPVWSQDSARFAYVVDRTDLYERPVTALEDARLLLRAPASELIQPTGWSPDGRWVLVNRHTPQTGTDIWAVSRVDGSALPLMQTTAVERDAQISPDGKWIAYTVSASAGENAVYVTAVTSSSPALRLGGGPWRISSGEGRNPRWRADSREIYYASGLSIVAVPVFTDTGFTVGPPTALPAFGSSAAGALAGRLGFVDAAPDGKRLLYARPVDTGVRRAPINVLLNWMPPSGR